MPSLGTEDIVSVLFRLSKWLKRSKTTKTPMFHEKETNLAK